MGAHWILALCWIHTVLADSIRGVNLGGWLVTERWITPSLYDDTSQDEWHLCAAAGKSGCQKLLQPHWDSFFTLDDFEEMKSVGLNSVRIPIGYWAVDVQDSEPYVNGQYPYLIRAVQWAQQLGFTVLIDVHGAPGSQNGQDNSGLIGPVLFPSNTSNIDRTLAVVQNLTQEFSLDQYGGVVKGIELLNEPRLGGEFSMSLLKDFYNQGEDIIRPYGMNTTAHDAFWGPSYWSDFNPSSPQPRRNFTLDTHQYYAFAPLNDLPHETILDSICNISQILHSDSIPPTVVGEWSLESGQLPNSTTSWRGQEGSQQKRTWQRLFFEAQLAAYSPSAPGQAVLGWYYWTWKTEWDIDTWSYRRGVAQSYIPSDVSNSSTFAFPVLPNGCVDVGFNYTAPSHPGRAHASASTSTPLTVCFISLFAIGFGMFGYRT